MIRHSTILKKSETCLLIVDIQKKLNTVMKYRERVIENTVKLVKGFNIFNLPIFVTEQFREGLGPTEPEILEYLNEKDIIDKMTFSCCFSSELIEQLKEKNIKQILLCGVETHVCVQQTALDLIANGFEVHLINDAISSRKKNDHKTSIQRMSHAGVIVTTTESALFELLERADSPEFRNILKVIK